MALRNRENNTVGSSVNMPEENLPSPPLCVWSRAQAEPRRLSRNKKKRRKRFTDNVQDQENMQSNYITPHAVKVKKRKSTPFSQSVTSSQRRSRRLAGLKPVMKTTGDENSNSARKVFFGADVEKTSVLSTINNQNNLEAKTITVLPSEEIIQHAIKEVAGLPKKIKEKISVVDQDDLRPEEQVETKNLDNFFISEKKKCADQIRSSENTEPLAMESTPVETMGMRTGSHADSTDTVPASPQVASRQPSPSSEPPMLTETIMIDEEATTLVDHSMQPDISNGQDCQPSNLTTSPSPAYAANTECDEEQVQTTEVIRCNSDLESIDIVANKNSDFAIWRYWWVVLLGVALVALISTRLHPHAHPPQPKMVLSAEESASKHVSMLSVSYICAFFIKNTLALINNNTIS